MSLPALLLRRLDRAVALALLGAVLLAVIGMGEAQAAVIDPPDEDPDGDPADDLVRPVGDPTTYASCEGYYGGGKAVLDIGDAVLATDDVTVLIDGTEATLDDGPTGFSSFLAEEFTAIGEAPYEGLLLLGFAMLEDAPSDCGGLDPEAVTTSGSPSFGPFDFEVVLPLVGGETLTCAGEYPITWWFAVLTPEGPGSSVEVYWTEAGAAPAVDDGSVVDEAIAARQTAAIASPIDCTGASEVAAPVSALALACDPAVASAGDLVTCTVTGGDPGIEILWRASASSAFAGAAVKVDAQGRGTFSFRVPASVGTGPITVELVDWSRTAPVAVVATGPVPSSVPAGEGAPAGGLVAGLALLAGALAVGGRRTLARE